MNNWPVVPLGSAVKFLSGGTPTKDEAKYWGGDIPWVSSGEMDKRRIKSTTLSLTQAGAENGTRLVPRGTLLVVVRGMSLAKEFRVSIAERELSFNQDVKAILPTAILDPYFLFYYLLSQSQAIKDSAAEAAHGTKKIDMPVLENWPLPIPPKANQTKIAAILSAYDDLIENNQRRIALLEKMAEELYREWFVRLRFPGHQKAPFEKGLPSGWCAINFAEICIFEKGRNINTTYYDEVESAIPYINVDTLENGANTYAIPAKNSILSSADDILMLMDGSRSGLVFRACTGIVGSTFALVKVAPQLKNVVYEYLRAGKDAIVSNNTGAAIPHANKEFINRMILILPKDKDLIEKFNLAYKRFMEQRRILVIKNTIMIKAKESLLNRLLSGKLPVDTLDIHFPPSMQDPAPL